MRWLIRSFITVVVSIPIIVHIASTDSLDVDTQKDNTGFLGAFENWAYDTRVRLNFSDAGIDEEVVILNIDERSIAEIGQWPWSRDKIAEIVDVLFDHYEIDVLGFDITFPEPERSHDLDLLTEIESSLNTVDASILDFQALRSERERDKIFAQSFEDRDIVLGFVLDSGDREPAGVLPRASLKSSQVNPGLQFFDLASFTGNLEVLQEKAKYGGNFNPISIDADGKIRRLPMLISVNDGIYDSLSLALIKRKLNIDQLEFIYDVGSDVEDSTTLQTIKIGPVDFPVGEYMTMLIPYKGPEGSFKYIPMIDILNKKRPKDEIKSVIGIVGTTAAGLKDFRVTPASENYPGVEIHANIVSGVLSGNTLYSPIYQDAIQLCLILVIGILLTVIMPMLPILLSTIVSLLIFLGVWFANLALWKDGLVIPVAPTLSFVALCYSAHLIFGSFIETRSKKQLSKLFGQYVPPTLVDEMEADLSSYSMKTQEAELTIMFADIRGFTPLSEVMSAEQVTQLLNEFLTLMTEAIHTKRGTIDKYMGDAIMAFWGAPLANENHAQDAVEAAFLMQEKMQIVNDNLSKRGLPNIDICIGLNTGSVRVGNMGSEFRMAYTVIGDAVNLASRLEALTRNYNIGIMLGESTREAVKEIACLELDTVRVKGKDKPVAIYEPIAAQNLISDAQLDMLSKHEVALEAYKEQDWSKARIIFNVLAEQYPKSDVFAIYLSRIDEFQKNPPGEKWDGVYTYTTK